MEKIEFIVSEWGFHSLFDNFEDAKKYCADNKLFEEGEGMLWIDGTSKEVLEKFMAENEIDHDNMNFKVDDEPHNWRWCSIDEKWEDSTEMEENGEEDFQEKKEVRKELIEKKYGIKVDLDIRIIKSNDS
ncbi:MAG: hypothetical protein HRT90_06945 [Candidatus Margulisbacteria bacterium]|nr:hypothetical protein [Candidatus Margulisiibacteriota bacterium]